MNNKGFIKLYRKIRGHYLWEENKTKSKFEAWVDLIFDAAYEDGMEINVNGNKVIVDRKMVATTKNCLAKRWGWSRGKVNRFFKELKNDDMIKLSVRGTGRNKYIIIVINNYDTYHGGEEETGEETLFGTVKNESVSDIAAELVKIWNRDVAPEVSKVHSLTQARINKIKTRLKEKGFRESFPKVIEKINKSDWLRGLTENSDWTVTFNYVIENDTHWVEILERKDGQSRRRSKKSEKEMGYKPSV